MSNESGGGLGSCLITLLVIMVFLAAFGFINWSTVGDFARFIVAIVVVSILFLIGLFIYGSTKK